MTRSTDGSWKNGGMRVKKRKILNSKVTRGFAGFLVFMCVCSIVSRGVYAYRMPQVTVASPESGMLAHEFEVEGTLEAVSEKAVVTVPGIRVEDICVRQGQTVKKKEVLFRLDKAEIQTKLDHIRTGISELKEKLNRHEQQLKQQKEQSERQQNKAARTRLGRQREDLETLREELTAAVEKARQDYRSACREVSGYFSWEQYFSEQKESSSEYLTLRAAAEKKDAPQEDKDAFSIFMTTFERSMKKEWTQGKESLEKLRAQAKEELESAKKARREALKRQRLQNRRENEDSRPEEGTDAEFDETAAEMKKSIAVKQRSADKYEKLLDSGGEVTCEKSGVVQKINVSIGENTTEGAAVVCADASRGFRFSAMITDQERQYVKAGDRVELRFRNSKTRLTDISISAVRDKGDGGCEVSVEFKSNDVSQGESGTMKIRAQSSREDCYIPISGLFASGTEYYVLVLREQETFLGTEYSVEKRKVEVSDKNNEYAALKGAPIESEERVVVSADREIKAGDNVRMLEGDE